MAGCGVFDSEQGDGQQSGTDGGGGSGGGKELNTYYGQDIPDLNSTTTTDSYSFEILYNINEGLYRLDEDEEPVPAMAEGVEVGDDGLNYTFTLRDGVAWSNGDPVTSEDFRYAWLRAMDPDIAGSYGFILSDYIEGGSEYAAGEADADAVAIEAPDEQTLEVTLASPTPFFLALTAFPTYLPLNQQFVEEQGDDFGLGADSLLYNGPYALGEFDPANQAVLEKRDDYWDAGNVDIDRVSIRIIKDPQTALNLYESGELDIVGLVAENVDQFRDSPEFGTGEEFWSQFLYLNHEDPALANENIRRAIMMSFDKQALVDTLLNDGSVPADGYVPDGMAGPGDQTFREALGPTAPEFDSEEARRLYEQGVEEIGEEPTLELMVSDGESSQDAGTFLKDQLENSLGATVEINTQPFDALLDRTDAGEYQMTYANWIADFNDPINFLDLFTTDSAFNDLNYSSERYDQLINDAKTESDPEARMDLLMEAERTLLEEDAALAPVYFAASARLLKPYVQNAVTHPYGPDANYKYWRIEGEEQ